MLFDGVIGVAQFWQVLQKVQPLQVGDLRLEGSSICGEIFDLIGVYVEAAIALCIR